MKEPLVLCRVVVVARANAQEPIDSSGLHASRDYAADHDGGRFRSHRWRSQGPVKRKGNSVCEASAAFLCPSKATTRALISISPRRAVRVLHGVSGGASIGFSTSAWP